MAALVGGKAGGSAAWETALNLLPGILPAALPKGLPVLLIKESYYLAFIGSRVLATSCSILHVGDLSWSPEAPRSCPAPGPCPAALLPPTTLCDYFVPNLKAAALAQVGEATHGICLGV